MTRRFLFTLILAAGLLLPSAALAQSAMTGIVKDTSGAVLPGVTVEASSEALIEKSKVGGHRRGRAVPHPGSASGHLRRDVLTDRLFDHPPDRNQLAVRVHDDPQRRPARRRSRGVDHGHRRRAGRRRDDCGAHAGAQPRGDGRDSDRPIDSGSRPARRRHQPEPAGHWRRARHAADLHVDPRHDLVEQHRDGGRHDGQRPAGRRLGAELLQRRDEPGGQLSDVRHRRGNAGWRRPPEHDSARGRQPVHRRLQGRVPAGRVAGREHHRRGMPHAITPRARRQTGSSTSRSPRADRSRRTSCGSSDRRATSRSTTSSAGRCSTTAARASTISRSPARCSG